MHMTAKQRILAISLSERISANPADSEKLGIKVVFQTDCRTLSCSSEITNSHITAAAKNLHKV